MEPVLVLRDAKPGLQTGRMKSLLDGRPGTRLAASDWHRSVRAMAIIIMNIEITLGLAKTRQDLLIRPFIGAESRPGGEILREAPFHGLTVDRCPTAEHLALRDMDLALFLGDRAVQSPVMF